jgi:Rad3-related DNA helicase
MSKFCSILILTNVCCSEHLSLCRYLLSLSCSKLSWTEWRTDDDGCITVLHWKAYGWNLTAMIKRGCEITLLHRQPFTSPEASKAHFSMTSVRTRTEVVATLKAKVCVLDHTHTFPDICDNSTIFFGLSVR